MFLEAFLLCQQLVLNYPERTCIMCIINDERGASRLSETLCGKKERENKGLKYRGGGQRIEMWCGSCVEGQTGVQMALGFMPYQDMVVESAFFFQLFLILFSFYLCLD